MLSIKHLGNNIVGHGILPRTRPARQLAKGLTQPSFADVEIKRWKEKRFRRFPALDPRLECANQLSGIDLEAFLDSSLARIAIIALLMSGVVKKCKVSQRYGKDKKIEGIEQLLFVVGRNIE